MNNERPLCYYAVSLFLGSYFTIMLNQYKFLGAVLTASFFIVMFLTVKKPFFFIVIAFFILGMISIKLYHNVNLPSKDIIKLRIVEEKKYSFEDKKYFYVGKYNNKLIRLYGNNTIMKKGEEITVKGDFIKSNNYTREYIGDFKVRKIIESNYDFFYKIERRKIIIYNRLNENLGYQKAAYIMALCTGEDKYLGKQDKNSIKRLGVIHAICVSGFHMAVVYKLFETLGGLYFAIPMSLLFVILTGASPSTIRAFIMIAIMKLSKKLMRKYDSLSALSFAAIIILFFKPYYVVNVGFILSFLSVLGIIIYYNRLNRVLYKLPLEINKALSMSLSAQMLSMPYAAIVFKKISVFSIIGNLFLMPIFSAIIVVGNISIMLSGVTIVFNLLCYILNTILTILDGAMKILLMFTPEMFNITYIQVAIYLLGYTWYLLFYRTDANLL